METSKNFCRICFSNNASKNLADLPKLYDVNQTYHDIMLFCLDIRVTPGSKYSTKLCSKCYKKVISFSKFKTIAQKNDAHLKSVGESVVFLCDFDIKKEEKLDPFESISYVDNFVKSETEVRGEEDNSVTDDEMLCAIKHLKYEYVGTDNENEPLLEEGQLKANKKKYKSKHTSKINVTDHEAVSDDDILTVAKSIQYEYMHSHKQYDQLTKQEKLRANKRKYNQTYKNKQEKTICEECGKSVKDIRTHMVQHNPSLKKAYRCKLCNKVYYSHSGRARHVRIKHKGIKGLCLICNKGFTNLRMHVSTVHNSSQLQFGCSVCGKRFFYQTMLTNHMTMHTDEKKYECDTCQNKYSSKLNLISHIRQVHNKEKSHLCQYCSKGFFKKDHLQRHLSMHTNEKPYKCEECGKNFSNTSALKRHAFLHTGVKNHKCDYCDLTFAHASYLRIHLVTHTKEKKHACKYCGIKFGRSDHRRNHERSAHEKHHSNLSDLKAQLE